LIAGFLARLRETAQRLNPVQIGTVVCLDKTDDRNKSQPPQLALRGFA
jgi:hypothetical protein